MAKSFNEICRRATACDFPILVKKLKLKMFLLNREQSSNTKECYSCSCSFVWSGIYLCFHASDNFVKKLQKLCIFVSFMVARFDDFPIETLWTVTTFGVSYSIRLVSIVDRGPRGNLKILNWCHFTDRTQYFCTFGWHFSVVARLGIFVKRICLLEYLWIE